MASSSPSMRHGLTSLAGLLLVAWLIALSPLTGTEVPVGQAQLTWIALPWAMVTLLLIGGCFLAVHGRELILHVVGLIVTTDSAPDAQGGVDIVTLSPSEAGSGLRHGLYNHESSAGYVTDWIAKLN